MQQVAEWLIPTAFEPFQEPRLPLENLDQPKNQA
jgi:hypothetical protein